MPVLTTPPLSLYVHFPWCVKKCPYCDFNSHQLKDGFDEAAYIDALIADLQQDIPLVWGRAVHSVFMGGGTPSLFSASSIERLMSALRSLLLCKPDMEVTMEVNPGTGEYDNFVGYRQAGVNRLSIGVQSLKDENLLALGRIHNAENAKNVYKQARQAGFDNINLDMMFALPGQSLAAAKKDLQELISLKPEHISYYQLSIEANTLFAAQRPGGLPGDDSLEAMYLQGNALLNRHGYQQYEVSAYSLADKNCQHNVNYWQFGDYLAIGAGAHSKITFAAKKEIKRYLKYKLPKKYLVSNPTFIQEQKCLSQVDLIFEFMLNAVRLKKPIKLSSFSARTGIKAHILIEKLQFALDMNWVLYQQDKLELTEKGFLLSDEILKSLL